MKNNFLEIFEELNKLYEAKEDQEKFIAWAGNDLSDKFYKIKDRLKGQEKDIYYWMKKSPKDLENKIDTLLKTKTKSQQNQEAKGGADLIYSDDTWNVYHIKTFEASKKYGAHTRWCITGKESGWIKNENENTYWKAYTEQGIRFYFYINKKENKKYALALYPDNNYELFDEEDNAINSIKDAPHIDGLLDVTIDNEFEIKDGVLVDYNGDSKEVTVPNWVESIGEYAFYNSSRLTSIVIPNSVKSIGEYAFYNCSRLTSIVIPNSVTRLGRGAFSHCTNLTDIYCETSERPILRNDSWVGGYNEAKVHWGYKR